MKTLWEQETTLNRDNIVLCLEKVDEIVHKETSQDKKGITRFKLAFEELLLNSMEVYGEDKNCVVECTKRFRTLHFNILVKGEENNPIGKSKSEKFNSEILEILGIGPSYRYTKGVNELSISLASKKKMNGLIQIAIAISLAIITSLILNALPSDISSTIDDAFINPLFNKTTSLLQESATPLVFFSVITGIVGIGDISSFGKIGKNFMSHMALVYGFVSVCIIGMGAIAFGINSSAADGGDPRIIAQITELVLDIIPNNLFTPFTTDNDLQVVAIAVFVGIVMLIMSNQLKRLIEIVIELSELINKMMLMICKCIPAVVYLGILSTIRGGRIGEAMQSYKVLILFVISAFLTVSFVILRAKRATKRPMKEIFKGQVPALLINLATSSQIAALPASNKCCRETFNLQDKLVDFALPLGIVTYMPNGAAAFAFVTWSMSVIEMGGLDIVSVIELAFFSCVIAIAAPPIPGSALVVIPILYSCMGLSNTTLPLALVILTLVGYFLPALNGFCLQLEVLITGEQLDLKK